MQARLAAWILCVVAAACSEEEGGSQASPPDAGGSAATGGGGSSGSSGTTGTGGASGSGGTTSSGGSSGTSGSGGSAGAVSSGGSSGAGGAPSACGGRPPKTAPPLPAPTGTVVEVSTAADLMNAVANAENGATIELVDGTYYLPNILRFRGGKTGVTLRSKSGNRDAVVIDGSQSASGEMIWFEDVKDITVAQVTVQNANIHCFTVKGEADADGVRIYDVRIRNCWERYVKGTAPNPISGADPAKRPRNGRIEYCSFEQDYKKQLDDVAGGDYIGGIDMMWLDNWVISDNVFRGIQGKNNQGRAAIFIWNTSEDVLVERNLVVDCDTGLAFGNPSGAPLHVTRGTMRNNMVTRGAYKAVELVRTQDSEIYNNSVYSAVAFDRAFHSFEGSAGIRIFNNLVHGQLIRVDDAGGTVENNLVGDLSGVFVDPAAGDLHLSASGAPRAIGQGQAVAAGVGDYDTDPRPAAPALGADECTP